MSGKLFPVLSLLILGCAFFRAGPLFAAGQAEKSPGAPADFNTLSADVDDAFAQMEDAFKPSPMDMTPEDEYYLGRAVAAEIIGAYGIYAREPALTEYLNKICLALTINSSRPTLYAGYHVEILDTPELCAFATPGGHIFIARGLAALSPSEDALAAVIAHELAHIQLRHAAEILGQNRVINELSAAADRAAAVAARGLSSGERDALFRESVSRAVDTLFMSGYSAAQEFEADAAARQLLLHAGYDPGGLLEMLSALDGQSRSGIMSATHPSPSARIARLGASGGGSGADTRSLRMPRFNSVSPRS